MNILWICYCGRHSFINFFFHWHFSPLKVAHSCCNRYFVAWPGCCDGRSHASNRIFQELLLNFAIFKYLNHHQVGTVCQPLAPPGQRLPDIQLHIFLGWHALVVFRQCKRNIFKVCCNLGHLKKSTIIYVRNIHHLRNILWMLLFVVPRIMWSKHVISLNIPHSAQVRKIQRWHDD